MKKVTHVVRQYLPSVGGMEEVVRNIAAEQLKETGETPHIITLNRLFTDPSQQLPSEEMIDGCRVTRLPYSGSSRYPLCPQVLALAKDAEVLHVHGVDFFYDFLALTRPIHRKPLILSTHGGFFHTDYAGKLKKLWFNTLTRFSAFAYNRVVATSENDGVLFRQVVSSERLEVIENGVDTIKYSDCASLTKTRTLIYFGRWSSNKGLLQTLDLLKALREQGDPWQLIIAGREYDYTAASLGRAIDERGLNDAVQVVSSPSNETLRTLISQATYFVCLSRHEGFGLAAIEALSAGLVPVLSRIPPFERLVELGSEGTLIDPSDPARGARAVIELNECDDSAAKARRTSAMAFARNYGWSGVAAQYFNLYRAIGG